MEKEHPLLSSLPQKRQKELHLRRARAVLPPFIPSFVPLLNLLRGLLSDADASHSGVPQEPQDCLHGLLLLEPLD